MRKIEISPAAVAVLCVLFYLDPQTCFAPFVFAAVLHEVGHLLALLSMGVPIYSLKISCFGAVISAAPLSDGRQIVCSLAGPAVNLTLFCFTARFAPHFAAVNALLAAYNLLPIAPLDGGVALRSALSLFCLPARQRKIGSAVQAVVLTVCAAAALYGTFVVRCGIWPLLFGALVVRLPREKPVAKMARLP